MKVSVYDTFVLRPDGRRMHFDILVPSDLQDMGIILGFGHRYLSEKGLPVEILEAEKCRYCHMETAGNAIEQSIAAKGFSIIEMENCN